MTSEDQSITCLVTGFEPFRNIRTNTSESVLQPLSALDVDAAVIRTAVLPVNFTRAAAIMTGLIKDIKPQVILMLGINRRIASLGIEKLAVNSYDKSASHKDLPIDPAGPPAFFTNFPVKKLLRALKRRRVPVFLSYHAGTYVCNFLYYTTARYLAQHAPDILFGFIHLPCLPEEAIRQGSPGNQGCRGSMELMTIVDGLGVVVKKLVSR